MKALFFILAMTVSITSFADQNKLHDFLSMNYHQDDIILCSGILAVEGKRLQELGDENGNRLWHMGSTLFIGVYKNNYNHHRNWFIRLIHVLSSDLSKEDLEEYNRLVNTCKDWYVEVAKKAQEANL